MVGAIWGDRTQKPTFKANRYAELKKGGGSTKSCITLKPFNPTSKSGRKYIMQKDSLSSGSYKTGSDGQMDGRD